MFSMEGRAKEGPEMSLLSLLLTSPPPPNHLIGRFLYPWKPGYEATLNVNAFESRSLIECFFDFRSATWKQIKCQKCPGFVCPHLGVIFYCLLTTSTSVCSHCKNNQDSVGCTVILLPYSKRALNLLSIDILWWYTLSEQIGQRITC